MDAPTSRSPTQSSAIAPTTPTASTASTAAAARQGSAAVSFGTVLGRRAGVHATGTRRESRAPATASRVAGSTHGASAAAGGDAPRFEAAHAGRKRGEAEDTTDGGGPTTSDTDAEGAAAGAKGEVNEELDALDPSARHAAHLAPPITSALAPAMSATASEPLRARSLEELLPALVRRIAWAGDRHKGTVRLELGAGVHAGTTVTVHADGGRVRVELGGAEGPDLDRLRTRLDARLRAHGLDVESVT